MTVLLGVCWITSVIAVFYLGIKATIWMLDRKGLSKHTIRTLLDS